MKEKKEVYKVKPLTEGKNNIKKIKMMSIEILLSTSLLCIIFDFMSVYFLVKSY